MHPSRLSLSGKLSQKRCALREGRRRMVDGCDGTRPDALAAYSRRTTDAHESDVPRHRVAHVEWLCADEQQGRLHRPAPGRAEPARLHPYAIRVCGAAALLGCTVVWRYYVDMDGYGQADSGRSRREHIRPAVLDHGHWRLHHAAEIGRAHV